VIAKEDCEIHAFDYSDVHTYDDCTTTTHHNSHICARGNSKVMPFDASEVEAYDDVYVTTYVVDAYEQISYYDRKKTPLTNYTGEMELHDNATYYKEKLRKK
jgi:hypothetical protein